MNKIDKVTIGIGKDSSFCRAIPLRGDMPLGLSKELTVQNLKGSLGEYLLLLLLNGFVLRMESEDAHGTSFIEALHEDYLNSMSKQAIEQLVSDRLENQQ
jgi:hypothetical protein